MYEISTNYLTNCSAKWSRIGQENEFLIATILGTEVKSGKSGNSIKYGKSGECEEYSNYNEEIKHGLFGLFGSIDIGCSSTRCQC